MSTAVASSGSELLPVPSKKPSYEEIKAKCLKEGSLYEDPDFEDVRSKKFQDCKSVHEWKRPKEFLGDSGVPEFFVGGASRFDIKQGELGDCWFLAAIATVSDHKDIFEHLIPPGQDFKPGSYAGIFRFNFWLFGKWTEVIIDDRLPVCNENLSSLKSSERTEFWSSLLEKAYAKLYGGYKKLDGGRSSVAFQNLTGGLCESYETKGTPPLADLWEILLHAEEKSSLLSAGTPNILKPDGTSSQDTLPSGLVPGHAYSITAAKEVTLTKDQKKEQLVRLRNPWGQTEWKGRWSDQSEEWKSISEDEKQKIGLVVKDDGEFWMPFTDFVQNYDSFDLCNLGPDSKQCARGKKPWEMTKLQGTWIKGVNAGGSTSAQVTYWTNPQFQLEILGADGGNDSETTIISLMQKERGKSCQANICIGIFVFTLSEELKDKPLGSAESFIYSSPMFQIGTVDRLKLAKGAYCVIPTTYEPNQEADFLLRIYTEKKIAAKDLRTQ